VAFIDDDAVAESVWIERLSQALQAQQSSVICTGRILPLSLDTEGQRLFESNGGLADGGVAPIELPLGIGEPWLKGLLPLVWWAATIGSGSNLTVHRRFALELGGFDEALDLGGDFAGGGDSDIIWRALETGSTVIYDPTVRVYHQHRADAKEAIDQIIRHHRGFMAFLAKAVNQTPGYRKISALAYLTWRLFKPGYRLSRRILGLDPLPAREILSMWRQSLLGLSDYPRRCREAEQRKKGPP
jgi:GT2 family glycosyltransferase